MNNELSPIDNLSAAFEGIENAHQILQECLCSIVPKAPGAKSQPEPNTRKEPFEIPWLKPNKANATVRINRMESDAIFDKIQTVHYGKEVMNRLWQMEAANNKITLLGAMYRIRAFLHDLSQPLASMKLAIDLLLMELDKNNNFSKEINLLGTEMESVLEIISEIRSLARETTQVGLF